MPLATRPWITAGVVLVGASVIAATPVTAPAPGVRVLDSQLTADEDMILDLVRHGQSADNVAGIIGTTPPGAALTTEGATQAAYLASPDNPQALDAPSSYDGIYASDFIRTQETAADWLSAAGAPTTPVTDLSGLDEINAGFLDGTQETELNGLLYLAAPLAWIFGQYWVPELGSTINPNGAAFEESFSGAVQTIYDASGATTNGDLTDVAFSHELAIMTWVMMNVKNPDFQILLNGLESSGFLSNTGQVVVDGNPTDGWTLVSWDGTAVPQDPGLATELFVDYRDLITAPQLAGYNIYEAILVGDPTTITNALQTGVDQVGAALVQFPESVYTDIVDAIQNLSTSLAGAAPGDVGTIISDALLGSL
ncbi:MAG: histidine phosphatase family protein [Mycobacterium sp.]